MTGKWAGPEDGDRDECPACNGPGLMSCGLAAGAGCRCRLQVQAGVCRLPVQAGARRAKPVPVGRRDVGDVGRGAP